MRAVGALIATLAFAVAAGCAGDDDPPEGAAAAGDADTPVAGLSATLQRSTLFETRRALLLTLRHEGDADIRVRTIQLETPLFDTEAPEERDARVRGGGRGVAMPLPFGTPRCDEAAEAGDGAVLVAEIEGEEVRLPIEQSPANLLAALNQSECAAAAVLADVELRLGDAWAPTAERTLAGDLAVEQRNAGVTATVDEVRGNVIFTVRTDETAPVAVIEDGAPSATTGIAITASRCDPHALIEYKRTFIFTAVVRVGDGEPVEVDLPAEGEARRVLEDLLASCIG
ncbi:MAG TPA: hypothetical protein VFZ77_07850 [Acidimicrobiales bacterium]